MSGSVNKLDMLKVNRRLAVVIGVNHSLTSQMAPLRYAVPDAQAMANVLEHSCDFEILSLLVDEGATSSAIKRAILNLARGRSDEDFLLVYFSGHGIVANTKAELGEVYIGSYDFDRNDIEVDANFHVSFRWLRDILFNSTDAEKVLIIFDCSYAGAINNIITELSSADLEQRTEYYFTAPKFENKAHIKNRLRLALAATEGHAHAAEKNGHGLMTNLLLSALRGEADQALDDQGLLSVQQLYQYLSRNLVEQRPSLAGDFAGLSCVLAAYPQRAINLTHRLKKATRPKTYIPFLRGSLSHSRTTILEQLEAILLRQKTKQDATTLGILGIVGMAGIGKTHLAAELAYRYQSHFPTAGVFWVTGAVKNFVDWQHRFAELALQTNYLPYNDDISHPDNEAQRARHICYYLATHEDSLLILDDIEDPNLIASILPGLAGQEIRCKLIYTSRNRSTTSSNTILYDVPPLTESESLHLLLETTRPHILTKMDASERNQEFETARQICRLAEYHPLTLKILQELLRRDTSLTLISLAEIFPNYSDNLNKMPQTSLLRAFQYSWQQVQNETAKRMFILASFFPELSTIPIELLGMAAGLNERDKDELKNAVQQLQSLGLLEVISGNGVRLHPLTREFGQQLSVDEYEMVASLLQHAQTIYEQFLPSGNPDRATVLRSLALLYYVQEQYKLAEPLLRQALTIYEQTLGPNHSDTAITLSNLALLYYVQEQYELAEPLLRQALTIYEQTLGPNHSDTAITLSNLALLYQMQRKYEQALSLLQRVLTIYEQTLAPKHFNIAMILSKLALLHYMLKQYEQAALLLHRTLTNYEQVFSSDSRNSEVIPNTINEKSLALEMSYYDKVTCLSDLGFFLQEMKDVITAHRCFEQMFRFLEACSASPRSYTTERELALQEIQDRLRALIQTMDKVYTSKSRFAKTTALNQAINILSHFPKRLNEFSQVGRLIVKRIVSRWHEVVIQEANQIGKFVILERVRSPYIFTPPVKDKALVGREDIFERITSLWSRQGQRNSLIIHGHRRMGKTSVAQALVSRCNLGSDTKLLYLSLEGQLLQHDSNLYYALSFRFWLHFKQELEKPDIADFNGSDARTCFDSFLALVNEFMKNSRFVLILDEFEMLYKRLGVAKANEILSYLRAQTITYTWLALALVGLSDLDDLRLSYNSSLLGWESIRISFLDSEQVKNVLANPPQDPDFPLDYTSEALDMIAIHTNGQPYLVQVIGDQLVQRYNHIVFVEQREHSGILNERDVKEVLEDPNFYSTAAAYFDGVWEQATKGRTGEVTLLKALTKYTDGTDESILQNVTQLNETTFTESFQSLIHHDVLYTKNGKVRYAVPLMRRWVQSMYPENSSK